MNAEEVAPGLLLVRAEEVERLRSALAVYADPMNWQPAEDGLSYSEWADQWTRCEHGYTLARTVLAPPDDHDDD